MDAINLYIELAGLRCFTRKDMIRLTGSEFAAEWHIKNFLKKGCIERVRRDLYVVISLVTFQPVPNRFPIASHITADSFISHHTAFEFYGCANQVFYDVYFQTIQRVQPFDYDGLHYKPVVCKGYFEVVETKNGIRVTSPERTVIESIADFTRIAGLEELLRCLILIPSLHEDKLLKTLEIYGQSQLYQKSGYILEQFQSELYLSDDFFEKCAAHISNSKTYLFEKQDDFVFHKKWLLYAPENLKDIIDKGIFDYDEVWPNNF